jgi:hypothetical protein
VVWNSGTFPDGTRPLSGTGDANRESLKRIRVPAAWISGDEKDIAWKNANDDFALMNTVPVMRAWQVGTGHSEVYREPKGGSYTPVAVAWLDWQLKGSKSGAAMFTGPECGLCRDSRWVIRWKGLP